MPTYMLETVYVGTVSRAHHRTMNSVYNIQTTLQQPRWINSFIFNQVLIKILLYCEYSFKTSYPDDSDGRRRFLVYMRNKQITLTNTVKFRYLELGYFEFCETRTVYLNRKYIFIAFFNHNLALVTFLQVQITRSAFLVFWSCKK